MIKGGELATAAFTLAVLACLGTESATPRSAAHAGRFRGLEERVRREARARHRRLAVGALMQAKICGGDHRRRSRQRSFGLPLEQFLAKRGGSDHRRARAGRSKAIPGGRCSHPSSNARRAAGPLLAILGMETGLRKFSAAISTCLSSIATLAYDCRRPEFFTDQLYATLKLIDRGVLSPGTRGRCTARSARRSSCPEHPGLRTGNLDVAANG